jgi:N-acetylated-alpha-linked acidic dipeptidase
VWKRTQARILRYGSATQKREARERASLRIDALGSGSDFTPFLQHLGVPSLNLGYGGEDGGGSYHSIYDTFANYTRFADTDFAYGRALAQTVGSMVMRVANAELLPYEFNGLAETVRGYVGEVKQLRESIAASATEANRLLDEGVFAQTTDPKEKIALPARESVPPFFNFAPLDNALDAFTRAAAHFERAYAKGGADAATRTRANGMMRDTERLFTSTDGLPLRPWYRHLLYAPGYYTGYGVKTLPGIREALEQKEWNNVEKEIGRVASALSAAATHVDRIAELLER